MKDDTYLRIRKLEEKVDKLEKVAHTPKSFVTLDDLAKFKMELDQNIARLSASIAREMSYRSPSIKANNMPKLSP